MMFGEFADAQVKTHVPGYCHAGVHRRAYSASELKMKAVWFF
jgi:hypothetical protein